VNGYIVLAKNCAPHLDRWFKNPYVGNDELVFFVGKSTDGTELIISKNHREFEQHNEHLGDILNNAIRFGRKRWKRFKIMGADDDPMIKMDSIVSPSFSIVTTQVIYGRTMYCLPEYIKNRNTTNIAIGMTQKDMDIYYRGCSPVNHFSNWIISSNIPPDFNINTEWTRWDVDFLFRAAKTGILGHAPILGTKIDLAHLEGGVSLTSQNTILVKQDMIKMRQLHHMGDYP
jgi:hypothetical protein